MAELILPSEQEINRRHNTLSRLGFIFRNFFDGRENCVVSVSANKDVGMETPFFAPIYAFINTELEKTLSYRQRIGGGLDMVTLNGEYQCPAVISDAELLVRELAICSFIPLMEREMQASGRDTYGGYNLDLNHLRAT